ncbi:sensor histidine kinase [Niastella caeni]|uniref:Sensor histidine kinase n=1 Tax=Niastella caeni TaxID=2569763 RepID=A0A4V4H0A5_9BACT|nr:histidine kinase [Niastella caeni]THU35816.1 sensor histidine kinase [Niastella caeni]
MKPKTTISLYWKCQFIGWAIASLYWGYAAFVTTISFSFKVAMVDFVLDIVVGILLSNGYRHFALKAKWDQLKLKPLVWRITPAVIVLALLYMILITGKLYLARLWFFPQLNIRFKEFFILNWLTVFITGTRLMSIWVLAYHLYHYAHREITTTKENARLMVVAKEAQLNNLAAQLNPHFFFNSLNNIKFLIIENPIAARRAIDLLSDLLRNSLYGKSEKLVLAKDEISLVKDYLELETLRFEERLQANIIADGAIEESYIPPLCIQTLVENAIKHGIEKRKNGGLVEVKAEKKEGYIQISVQNPGKLSNAHQPGLGLKNLEERLLLQYNGKATCSIKELPGEKISVTILIPIA